MLQNLKILMEFNRLAKALKGVDMLNLLKSRTVWTFVAMALVNGVEGIKNQLPADALDVINPLLALAGSYFRYKATAPK
jgi:hypothetical protein